MLPAARQAYVNRVHTATGFSPNNLHFGFQSRMAVATFSTQVQLAARQPFYAHVQDLTETLEDLDERALASMLQQFHASCAIRAARVAGKLELHNAAGPLQHQARGPHRVVRIDPQDSIILQTGAVIGKAAVFFQRHASRLELYHHKLSLA